MCQGFSGVVNASNQGFAGLQNTITNGDASIQQSLCQGFGGINTAILTASKDTALQFCQSTNAIAQAISDCCCKTQAAIAEQGQLTRDLINQRAYADLQEKYCDAKSKISSLETQAAFNASQMADRPAAADDGRPGGPVWRSSGCLSHWPYRSARFCRYRYSDLRR
jgi:hypothetical protein